MQVRNLRNPIAKLHVMGNIITEGYLTERSDRAAKTAFTAVNGQQVLSRLSGLPVTKWSYKDEAGVRHMGPVAQDFYAAFGLGANETHIAALDANGVALTAIQALNAKVAHKDARILSLERQVAVLNSRLTRLAAAGGTLSTNWSGGVSLLALVGVGWLALRGRAHRKAAR